MTFFRDLAVLLRFAGFRRLFAVRLLSQLTDGIFQVALASTLIFSPERAPTAGAIAAAFAVVLLPFTLLGPFVGVFLDRWPRRRTLVLCNVIRAGILVVVAILIARDDVGLLFFLVVLLAFSVNRFLLAGLSASLPHVVTREVLVTANAVTPTCGTLAYLLGLAAGGFVHARTHADAMVVVVAVAFYLAAAALARTLPFLGPDLAEVSDEVRDALGNVAHGLVDALRNLPYLARLSLGLICASRLPYGVMIVGAILLFRNHLAVGSPERGLAGVGLAFGASGFGFALAAILTPMLTKVMGMRRTLVLLCSLGAVVVVFPLALFTLPAVLVSAFGLGVSTQGLKICVDTTIQSVVGDVYRGRVFALYDVLFNVAFVLATVVAAIALPTDGRSYVVLVATGLWFAGMAAVAQTGWRGTQVQPLHS